MLRGKAEGKMALLSEGSSVKESPEDKQTSVPCVKGSAKISRQVTLACFTGVLYHIILNFHSRFSKIHTLPTQALAHLTSSFNLGKYCCLQIQVFTNTTMKSAFFSNFDLQ